MNARETMQIAHFMSLRTTLALVCVIAFAGAVNVATAQNHSSPPEHFAKVSSLVELPDFVPGLGILYVDPETLPAGPFLSYDRDGRLVSTIYMIPLTAMNDHQAFNGLDVSHVPVDHVDVNFNAGHPGLPEPHYHVVLWHVSRAKAGKLQ